MKIRAGEIYVNRTARYLLPCIKDYGKQMESKINSVFKLGVGVGDRAVDLSGLRFDKHFYILIDVSGPSGIFFLPFITWLREQPYYAFDYSFDNVLMGHQHMVIVEFPKHLKDAMENFKLGQYSLMYSQTELAKYFYNKAEDMQVLQKDMRVRQSFVDFLNKEYNLTGSSKIKPEEYEGELDLPFRMVKHQEIFNFQNSEL